MILENWNWLWNKVFTENKLHITKIDVVQNFFLQKNGPIKVDGHGYVIITYLQEINFSKQFKPIASKD